MPIPRFSQKEPKKSTSQERMRSMLKVKKSYMITSILSKTLHPRTELRLPQCWMDTLQTGILSSGWRRIQLLDELNRDERPRRPISTTICQIWVSIIIQREYSSKILMMVRIWRLWKVKPRHTKKTWMPNAKLLLARDFQTCWIPSTSTNQIETRYWSNLTMIRLVSINFKTMPVREKQRRLTEIEVHWLCTSQTNWSSILQMSTSYWRTITRIQEVSTLSEIEEDNWRTREMKKSVWRFADKLRNISMVSICWTIRTNRIL